MFGFNEKHPKEWASISSESDLADILKSSNEKPQIIFKHSPRCSVSFFAKNEMQTLNGDIYNKLDLNFVDVIKQRPLSQFIAKELSVFHESPQLIFLKDGEVVWHGSHSEVNASNVNALVNQPD